MDCSPSNELPTFDYVANLEWEGPGGGSFIAEQVQPTTDELDLTYAVQGTIKTIFIAACIGPDGVKSMNCTDFPTTAPTSPLTPSPTPSKHSSDGAAAAAARGASAFVISSALLALW